MKKVIIFDTTLRDGEQSPGASLNTPEKLEIARALARMKVDVIEAGFPITSDDDFNAVRLISEKVRGPTIAALARCVEADIVRAAAAVAPAKKKRIHVFLATSPIHRRFKFEKAKGEIFKLAVKGVRRAKSLVDDVEFSPEDASRTEHDFLAEVVEAAIDAGATTINIPDTVGYAIPQAFAETISFLRETVPNVSRAVISVHCHDDLGLAVANSLAAVRAGARQVECTINGLGERAGNAALEEVVMALRTRSDFFDGFKTRIETRHICPTSRLVSRLTGMTVQRNKAIVGDNAFAHEAGIHVHGVLKERSTYEIMRPEDVGLKESRIVIGKHTGRHAVESRIRSFGYALKKDQLEEVKSRVKALADRKKSIYDADLEAILRDYVGGVTGGFELVSFHVSSGSGITPVATVTLRRKKGSITDAAVGDGPVDAVYNAIDRITKLPGKLLDYRLEAVTGGREALGEVAVSVKFGKEEVTGRGASTDIVEASIHAYLQAVNRASAGRKKDA